MVAQQKQCANPLRVVRPQTSQRSLREAVLVDKRFSVVAGAKPERLSATHHAGAPRAGYDAGQSGASPEGPLWPRI
jgi:hypothetical protein